MLVIPAGDNVVRLLPPLIIDDSDIEEAISRLDKTCQHLEAAQSSAGAHK
jgi:acetylornithine/N-succinyldiaminopimelate aminotransferase